MSTNTERPARAGFQAGYSGLTREAYELDLRQYASRCHQHHLRLFQACRADSGRQNWQIWPPPRSPRAGS